MTDIVERLRDQCCRLGHDDHGHTDCTHAAAVRAGSTRQEATMREPTMREPDALNVVTWPELP